MIGHDDLLASNEGLKPGAPQLQLFLSNSSLPGFRKADWTNLCRCPLLLK